MKNENWGAARAELQRRATLPTRLFRATVPWMSLRVRERHGWRDGDLWFQIRRARCPDTVHAVTVNQAMVRGQYSQLFRGRRHRENTISTSLCLPAWPERIFICAARKTLLLFLFPRRLLPSTSGHHCSSTHFAFFPFFPSSFSFHARVSHIYKLIRASFTHCHTFSFSSYFFFLFSFYYERRLLANL